MKKACLVVSFPNLAREAQTLTGSASSGLSLRSDFGGPEATMRRRSASAKLPSRPPRPSVPPLAILSALNR